jgi:60 kDa SS-A/Ro ribonucleoprotein
MGAMANYLCEESLVLKFDDQLYSCTMPTSNGIISNALAISVDGGGTNIALPLNYILEHNLEFDRMILLSDNEINSRFAGRGWKALCQSLVTKYRKEINKNFWVHAIDLLDYGTQQFAGEKTNIIAGWSEGILGFINIVENGLGDLITTIEEYGLV